MCNRLVTLSGELQEIPSFGMLISWSEILESSRDSVIPNRLKLGVDWLMNTRRSGTLLNKWLTFGRPMPNIVICHYYEERETAGKTREIKKEKKEAM